jgi:hypothetical protein
MQESSWPMMSFYNEMNVEQMIVLPGSDGGGGRITRRYRASSFGSLPAATLSRVRSNRTLVEASHPSLHGQNM